MKFVRVTCEHTACEGVYLGEDIEKSESTFLKNHPCLTGLKLSAKIIDNEDPRQADYFNALRQTGWSMWNPD